MEADLTFAAKAITHGPLDDVSTHVAWGDDATDPTNVLILMRDDEAASGDAPYCVVWGAATEYGGVIAIDVEPERTTVQLTEHCAETLGAPQQICIEHAAGSVDLKSLRASVERILAPA